MHSNTDHGDSGITFRSDCKENELEERWTQLLLNWISLCDQPASHFNEINQKAFRKIINKYQDDICDVDVERKLLNSEDIETFIKFKYPALDLSDIASDDTPRKLCVLASILLYHCCVNSRSGVDADICCHFDWLEQELLLKFCEKLGATDVTVANVEAAITEALASTSAVSCAEFNSKSSPEAQEKADEGDTSESVIHESNSTIASLALLPQKTAIAPQAVTVLQSSVMPNSSRDVSHYSRSLSSYGTLDSMKVYNVQKARRGVKFQETHVYTSSSSDSGKCPPVCSCTACEKAKKGCGDTGDTSKCEKPTSSGGSGRSCLRKIRAINFSPAKWFKIIGVLIVIGILLLVIIIPLLEKPQPKKAIPPPTPLKHITSASTTLKRTGKRRNRMTEPPTDYRRHVWPSFHHDYYSFIETDTVPSSTTTTRKKRPRASTIENSKEVPRSNEDEDEEIPKWQCVANLCQKVYDRLKGTHFFKSLSRCSLMCTGPLLWPWPIGYTSFSNNITAFGKSQTDYKFKAVTSVIVHQYLAEAFKLFLSDLERLERIDMQSSNKDRSRDIDTKQLYIEMYVHTDSDPRLRLDTDESYTLRIKTTESQLKVEIQSASFAGVRHGLETLSQLIYLDQATGYLITLSDVVIKDAPSFKYRGLMIDTARNYIPMPDLMRTIDAMSSVKFNTFHWRISDATSFPWLLPDYPELFEFGGYDRSLVYTTDDVKTLVSRAGLRGIRVLIEVAAPGPVGRAWSWSNAAACQNAARNATHCDKELCRRLKMRSNAFDMLENIYHTILQLTEVDDIFHMSDGVFSFVECYYLLDSREGFLSQALDRLRVANKGLLPQLPVIWYTAHLTKSLEANTWQRLGVQLNEWQHRAAENFLTHYKVIHSSNWDLSCEIKNHRCIKYKTWQELYSWTRWKSLEVFKTLGGETTLWTDLVDGTNLDTHLWPRAAAVAERLWSDEVANRTAATREILRMDAHRWRLLLRSVKVQPVWPIWCTFNPGECLKRIR